MREKSSTYLVLEWSSPRGYNGRVSYVLQMADFDPTSAETSKFKMIYDGKDSQFTVSKLRRATKYRFRYVESAQSPICRIYIVDALKYSKVYIV